MHRRKPEVMSPAAHWPQLRAAIEAGADAVYFGLKNYSARAKVGFDLEELPEAMRTLHRRGVRGFITFNTLIFEHELREAARTAEVLVKAGADALIVQDLGMVRLIREIAPDIEIHASTQMSVTDAAGVRTARELGCTRVTLARELSLDEIRTIAAESELELEVFVHGALCVAYSGQCFSSEAWGGRSANRGQCAQACRLPYQMLVDGIARPLGDARYLLSPGDLYALHQVPELIDIGIATLKIEGRYKDAGYVALTTAAYRKAVDEAWEQRALSITPQEELALEQIYSRGLAPRFLEGTNHQTVVNGRAPRHRGVLMGRATRVGNETVVIETGDAHALSPLKPGDGIVFDAAHRRSPEEREEGGRIFEVRPQRGNQIQLAFANNALDFSRIAAGDWVWRTHDPELERNLRPVTEAAAPVRKLPVHVRVEAHQGRRLRMTWQVEDRAACAVVESPEPLDSARQHSLHIERLRDQLARLGGTQFELATLTLDQSGSPFLPASLLNSLRRQAVEELERALCSKPSVTNSAASITDCALGSVAPAPDSSPAPRLHLLVRAPAQLDAAIGLEPGSITLDYLDLYGLRPSVERVKSSGVPVRVATPRILKPGERKILNFLVSLDCAILVRGVGMIEALADSGRELIADFSLNAANSLTASWLLERGFARLTPTHDLNAAQITELAERAGGSRLEVIAYQHLPVFHTEHCVFCRFLSTGTSYRDCGRPCEKHMVALRDTNGRAHPVMADAGCRNTVFGAEAQHAAAHIQNWLDRGIRDYRLEFAHESAREVIEVHRAFEAAFTRGITADELARRIGGIAPGGLTEGSLYIPKDWRLNVLP